MNFDHRVEYDRFLEGLHTGALDESVQFELRAIYDSAPKLAASSLGFSPADLFLDGAEKRLVRFEE